MRTKGDDSVFHALYIIRVREFLHFWFETLVIFLFFDSSSEWGNAFLTDCWCLLNIIPVIFKILFFLLGKLDLPADFVPTSCRLVRICRVPAPCLAVKYLDSVIVTVSNHNPSTLLHHTHSVRVVELSIFVAFSASSSNGEESGSFLVHCHHTVVPMISNDDIPCLLVHTQINRRAELSLSIALRSELVLEIALEIELLHSIIAVVSNIEKSR
jgi:hypothetical protein